MHEDLTRVVSTARAAGRTHLLETEGLALAEGLGLGVPRHIVVADAAEAGRIVPGVLPGDRVVVKVLAPDVQHKTDVGGVAVVDNDPGAIAAAVEAMGDRLGDRAIVGFLVAEFVAHDRALGGELLLGARWTEDFGPVVTFGAGGTDVEFLAASLRPGQEVAILSPAGAEPERVRAALQRCAIARLVTRGQRGQPPRLDAERLEGIVSKLLAFADVAMPDQLVEIEFNPVVPAADGLVALDALARIDAGGRVPTSARPLHKLRHLLEPRSIAIVGVSEKLNPGHMILNNVLREGFPRERVYVVKPNVETIEGCRCWPDVASLPETVDLFVVAVDAAQVPQVVEDSIEHRKAETLVLIPGGLGELEGTEERARSVHDALLASRSTPWGGPLINGGNCLGVRSRPGRFDTLFIPEHKLQFPGGPPAPLAFLSQSGAFAVARSSDLGTLEPRFVVTCGNQIDLTIGDYLTWFADDPEVAVLACYVEGFRPLDGRRFLEAARRITDQGRAVVLYRAGRTAAGASAAASHTASIAGDFAVTRALAESAGVFVADSLEEFDDLVRLCVLLRDKRVDGLRLGAVTNAGFEAVAIADNLGPLRLAEFSAGTKQRLGELLDGMRLGAIVGVHNPLDLTPIAGDRGYQESVQAVLEADEVDVGLVGCVPLTGAMQTLPAGEHGEDLTRPESVVERLAGVFRDGEKAWVAVVDGGALYDPMARHLAALGVPTFRRADRALRAFARYCRWRCPSGG